MTGINHIDNSDELVMATLTRGNPEALAALYDKYAPALLGILQKTTGNRDLAEEALQVCFIKIWQNKGQYNFAAEKPFTWMLKIAREVAKSIPERKIKDLKNQNSPFYVSKPNGEDCKLIMEQVLLGSLTEKEAAEIIEVPVNELRQMVRKEINQLRGISAE